MKLALKNLVPLWAFLTPSLKRLAILSLFLGAIAGAVEYVFIIVLQLFLFSLGVTNSLETDLPSWVPTSLTFTLAMLVLAGFLRSFSNGAKIFVSRMISQLFFKTIRERILNAALKKDSLLSTSSVLTMFSDETTRAGIALMNLSTGVIALVNGAILLVLAMNVAFEQTLVGIGLLCILAIPILWLSKFNKTTGNDISQEWAKTNELLISSIRNHFFLNIYGLLDRERDKAHESLSKYFRHYLGFVLTTALKVSTPLFFGTIVIAALSLYSVHYQPIGGATLLSFLYLFLRVIQAFSEFSATTNDFAVNSSSLFKIRSWLNASEQAGHQKQISGPTNDVPSGSELELSVKNSNFHYSSDENRQAIIKNLNLQLKTGDCLVITGESGAGKSTLLSLLLGILQPTSGEITINKKDIHSVRDWLCANVSYVGPTPYIVEGTLVDNLLYGHPNPEQVSSENIWEALKQSELGELVSSLPTGLETELNEIASRLSTGQRQRLTIARALLRKPKIVVLDEASSNLDQQTENNILKQLKPFLSQWITLVVSHRPAFSELATQNLHLEKIWSAPNEKVEPI